MGGRDRGVIEGRHKKEFVFASHLSAVLGGVHQKAN